MLPDHERIRIPEGHYKFQIMADPEKRSHVGQSGKKFISIKFQLKATDEFGASFSLSESFLAFEDKYADLLLALGAEEKDGRLSGSTIEPIGMFFVGEVIHEPDKNDPSKTWTRIVNIEAIPGAIKEDESSDQGKSLEDDDVPF